MDVNIPDDDFEPLDEPVDAAEVDSVLQSVTELMDSIRDPVIREILEDACFEIAELIGTEEEPVAQAA